MPDTRRCPSCGSESSLAFASKDRRGGSQRFRYFECSGCGLVFLAEPPHDLAAYYGDDYYRAPLELDEFLWAARSADGYKVDLVRQHVAGGRLLDIGAGRGGFAYLAREAGFAVTAVEMDAECYEFASRVLGIEAINTPDPRTALDGAGPYDAITLWHVLEHLDEPWSVVAAAQRALRPGGVLVIATPNPHAVQARVLRSRWAHLDPPRHLYLIPRDLLAGWTELELVSWTTSDPGGLAWNRFGWAESFAALASSRLPRAALRRAGRAVGLLARPLERAEGRGAAYTVVLRR